MRGYFHGATDETRDAAHKGLPLLHSVLVTPAAAAIGKTLREIELGACQGEVKTVRRRDKAAQSPEADAAIEAGDVLVLYGAEHGCAAAEIRVMQG